MRCKLAKASEFTFLWQRARTWTLLAHGALLLAAAGCGSEERRGRRDWEQAAAQNSIESYEAYLDRYPRGAYKHQAYARLEPLLYDLVRREPTLEAAQHYLDRLRN